MEPAKFHDDAHNLRQTIYTDKHLVPRYKPKILKNI